MTEPNRPSALDPESQRLHADNDRQLNWKRWGPYLADRQWGTVREDYSEDGNCWGYFSHEDSRSRAYRWGEDGLLGFTDRQCRICFGLALWNGRDPFLKERLFGLTNPQGNHGEDVKEAYYYLRSTPTHSYFKGLYLYPQEAFPYEQLLAVNGTRSRSEPEFELADARVFHEGSYFSVEVEYAKASPEDLLINITLTNHAAKSATLHVLPQIWFRNVWSWKGRHLTAGTKPTVTPISLHTLELQRETLGRYHLHCDPNDPRRDGFLITENKTNYKKLFGSPNLAAHVKDGFHDYIVQGKEEAISRTGTGTKAAAPFRLQIPAGASTTLRLRFQHETVLQTAEEAFADFDPLLQQRRDECEAFYANRLPQTMPAEVKEVAKQAYAGLLWSKQFYYYPVADWIPGDPGRPMPPWLSNRRRNQQWKHVFARDVISMPDKWEYPWFAAWDLAFHMEPMAEIDPKFAKQQILLLLREWYMHPNGQIPAYEFSFDDVNPPVHAWAAWQVYQTDARLHGKKDRRFLAGAFQKLLLNFTWWVNQTDKRGQGIFAGGFLGLDNIGIFDRGADPPTGGQLQQADATAWMAFYCCCMLRIALELAWDGEKLRHEYEDMASKFLAHFVQIAEAIHTHGGTGLWDALDGFYYDHILTGNQSIPLKTRSLVGLLPLIAVEVIPQSSLDILPGFRDRFEWHLRHNAVFAKHIVKHPTEPKWLLALATRERLLAVLRYMLDEEEFLSPHGLRSLSKYHKAHPFSLKSGSHTYEISYQPGESETTMFGGNSNWRGPVWFPINHLIIEALERYHTFFGPQFLVEHPSRTGKPTDLHAVAEDLRRRHLSLFLAQENGTRPCHGTDSRYVDDPQLQNLVLFYEFFHGDTGKGLGASHQTGWTALVASQAQQCYRPTGS
jgi:hypothetical protein